MAILQFPSEGRQFRQLRTFAREQFQREIRQNAIAQLGPEASDMAVLVSACKRCGLPSSELHVINDLMLDATQGDVQTLVGRLLASAVGRAHLSHCAHCLAGGEELVSVVGHFGRLLPESGQDLQLEFIFGDKRIVRVDHHRMSADGETVALAGPVDELAFHEAFGAPMSMRGLWNAFIARHATDYEFVTMAVQKGYLIGLRPYADDVAEAVSFYDGFDQFMERQRGELPFDTVTFLRDREEDEIPIPLEESYHAWLEPWAVDIADAALDPFIVADSGSFVRVLDELASRRGVRVKRDSGDDTLYARFEAGEVYLRLNIGPRYFRTLHTGQTFHRGVMTYFGKEILAIKAAGELAPVLRRALPGLRISVRDGKRLEIADRFERLLFCDDIVRVATSHDFRSEAGLRELLAQVLPEVRALG